MKKVYWCRRNYNELERRNYKSKICWSRRLW
jgi:hypothetical protein